MKRPAQIIAVSLSVLCPYCGEPQPSPGDGSDIWLPQEVKKEAVENPKHICVSCDCIFPIHEQNKVTVST